MTSVIVMAENHEELVVNVEFTAIQMRRWMREKKMSLAENKMVAIILKGHRKRQITYRCGQELILPKNALKYFGVTLNHSGSFGRYSRKKKRKEMRYCVD